MEGADESTELWRYPIEKYLLTILFDTINYPLGTIRYALFKCMIKEVTITIWAVVVAQLVEWSLPNLEKTRFESRQRRFSFCCLNTEMKEKSGRESPN